MTVDYAPAAIEARLRAAAALTDLRPERRLHGKIDYSAEAVSGRLRLVEELRRACVELAKGRRCIVPIDEP